MEKRCKVEFSEETMAERYILDHKFCIVLLFVKLCFWRQSMYICLFILLTPILGS